MDELCPITQKVLDALCAYEESYKKMKKMERDSVQFCILESVRINYINFVLATGLEIQDLLSLNFHPDFLEFVEPFVPPVQDAWTTEQLIVRLFLCDIENSYSKLRKQNFMRDYFEDLHAIRKDCLDYLFKASGSVGLGATSNNHSFS